MQHGLIESLRGIECPRLVEKSGETRLKFRQRADASLRFIGVVFLPLGLFLCSTPWWDPKWDSKEAFAFALGLGSFFALFGAVLLLGRRDIVIDRQQDYVSVRWGVVVPIWIKRRPLSAFSAVQVRDEPRTQAGLSDTNYEYFVRTVSFTGTSEKPFAIFASPFHGESEALASEIAGFTGLNLIIAPANDRPSTVASA